MKKKPLNTEELYSIAKKKLKYPDEEISVAIYKLVLNKYLVKKTKISKDNILENEIRNRIFKYISEHPSTHLREIRDSLKLSPYNAAWHLQMLEKFNLIQKYRISNKVVFFNSNIKSEFYDFIYELKQETNFKTIETILLSPGIEINILANKLQLGSRKVENIISKLQENDWVYEIIEGEKTKYFAKLSKLEPILRHLNISEERIKEFKEIEAEYQRQLETKPLTRKPAVIPTEAEGGVKVVREYDYVGGDIRFKVAVRNETQTIISKISVILNPSTQYRINERIQEIDVLTPGESRGVDFTLIPLTCGKSKVFGTLSYVDAFGKPHSQTISEKEIHIKCPLVTPKKATKMDIENWKKSLLRGSTKIHYFNISGAQAFRIACDQVSALDLAEVDSDYEKLIATYSGVAKVTGNSMVVEINNDNSDIQIQVWTSDMKQATGFIAYIKNLINVSLEVAQKLQLKVEKMGQTILDCFDISERMCRFYECCEEREIIHEITLLLGELIAKIERSFPDLKILEDIKNSLTKLENFRFGDSINDKLAIQLEMNVIDWLKELLKIIQNNAKTYQETFKDQDISFNKIKERIEQLEERINKNEERFSINILRYLMVIDQKSGLTLFNHGFGDFQFDSDLVSGFLTAIQSFGTEISQKSTQMKKLAYQDFEISMDDGEKIRVALVLAGPITSYLESKLKEFISIFESRFANELQNWSGDVSEFHVMNPIADEIFMGKKNN